MIIYRITNNINGKVYIGQTRRSLHERWKDHISSSLRKSGSKSAIHSAIAKYGESVFTIEQLATASSQEELNSLEKQYIDSESSVSPSGYNLTTGGDAEYSFSEEVKSKISDHSTRLWQDPEHKRRVSEAISDKWSDPEYKDKVRTTLETAEYKDKKSRISRKIWQDDDYREKQLEVLHKINTSKKKKVICLDDGKTYNSVAEAARAYNIRRPSLSSMLTGKSKTVKGLRFKYLREEDG